ncbi:HTH-type transcriptional activator RhaR [Paenibacillus solanacearum]|uniref:HTH-type transcriptional activator RhaR n=1 Tax=Paenibacillus solanacearum TaxID=2048548 RepID=A0A916JZS7_9BACL|nr:AraC family transcriptional regulator [Paenibacillus solanacearum]CAG7618203.1 HTH-type transcriptional activator RhaR [Paenibacillus solanacearum]
MSETIELNYGAEEDDFYIQHVKRTEPFERTNHFHGTYEVYYLISGQRTYFIKDRSYLISPGDLVFINKLDLHKTSDVGEPGHERVVINFSDRFLGSDHPLYTPALFAAFQHPSHVFRLKLQDQLFVQHILKRMTQELKEKATGYETYVKLLLMELLLFAGRCSEKQETVSFEHRSPMHKKISEVVRHINDSFHEPLTLAGLSERFYMSPFYLSRAFREVTGFTFVEYVNTTRIKEAQRLLKETNMKIIEIADAVGFENIAHFGRMFKKLARLTPLEYRKLNR